MTKGLRDDCLDIRGHQARLVRRALASSVPRNELDGIHRQGGLLKFFSHYPNVKWLLGNPLGNLAPSRSLVDMKVNLSARGAVYTSFRELRRFVLTNLMVVKVD